MATDQSMNRYVAQELAQALEFNPQEPLVDHRLMALVTGLGGQPQAAAQMTGPTCVLYIVALMLAQRP